MKKATLEHVFDFPLEKLVEGRAARYSHPEWWPEISEARIEKEVEENGQLHLVRRVFLDTKIPAPANKVIPGGKFEVLEKSWYDKSKKNFKLDTTLETFNKLVDFREVSEYTEFEQSGSVKSKRIVNISVKVNVPLIGSVVEKLICQEFEKQSNKDRDVIIQYINSLS